MVTLTISSKQNGLTIDVTLALHPSSKSNTPKDHVSVYNTLGFDINQFCGVPKDPLGDHFHTIVIWLKATVLLTDFCHFVSHVNWPCTLCKFVEPKIVMEMKSLR